MRYAEFKRRVEQLELKVVRRPGVYYVVDGGEIEWLVASVSSQEVCVMTSGYFSHMVPEEKIRQLFHILVKFSQTSIEERHYDDA